MKNSSKDTSVVSRGAHKLLGFVKKSQFNFRDKVVADIGSSHGGFVQVILVSGAKKIYAVDVGKGLLDWKLRNQPNIVLMEGINARDLKKEDFIEQPQVVTVDLSFISIKKILPQLFTIATESIIILLKPQFEADYDEVSKGAGVITDVDIHHRIIEDVKDNFHNDDWTFIGAYPSEITGRKGNQEYFLYYERIQTQ